jgi:hypothetical protein
VEKNGIPKESPIKQVTYNEYFLKLITHKTEYIMCWYFNRYDYVKRYSSEKNIIIKILSRAISMKQNKVNIKRMMFLIIFIVTIKFYWFQSQSLGIINNG